MTYAPFFVDLVFSAPSEEADPTYPVERISMGYVRDDGSIRETELSGDGMWRSACDIIRDIGRKCAGRQFAIVGWNLRNLVWPAFVLNAAMLGERLPKSLVKPIDRKWNDCLLIDLRNEVLQGGYSNRPLGMPNVPGATVIQKLVRLHDMYANVASVADVGGIF